jgi:hypothetical protein
LRCRRPTNTSKFATAATTSLAPVYGSITFISEHPAEVEAYLRDQERILDQIKAQYPMSQDMIDRFERARNEAATRPA